MTDKDGDNELQPEDNKAAEVRDLREAELQMTGHAPVATQFAGWGTTLPANAQGEQDAATSNDQAPSPTPEADGED